MISTIYCILCLFFTVISPELHFFVCDFLLKAYPPESKSEALQLGVQLILLYSIRISLLIMGTFFYFDGGWSIVDGGWGPTFWFFKSLDNNMVNTLGIYVCI